MFILPIDEILNNRKNNVFNQHYFYANYEYEIEFSHLQYEFNVSICKVGCRDNLKEWTLRSITKSSLKGLEDRINKYLVKIGSNEKFYDVDVFTNKYYKSLYKQLKGTKINSHNKFINICTTNGMTYQINVNSLNEEDIIINDNNSINMCMLDTKSLINIYKLIEENLVI